MLVSPVYFFLNRSRVANIGDFLHTSALLVVGSLHVASGLPSFWSWPWSSSLVHMLHDLLRHDWQNWNRRGEMVIVTWSNATQRTWTMKHKHPRDKQDHIVKPCCIKHESRKAHQKVDTIQKSSYSWKTAHRRKAAGCKRCYFFKRPFLICD